MPVFGRTSIQGLIAVLVLCAGAPSAQAEDWLPISPEELTMTSEPHAPGAPAILLYRQVDRDDNGPTETIYARIKILTEEGRKFADVEIPFYKGTEYVHAIQARTVHSDGSIVGFNSTIYDKPIVQARAVKLLAKTFTMPDVQVGSIIEYRYKHDFEAGYVFNSNWVLSQDLFTRYAKFSLDPYRRYAMSYSWPAGLPPDTAPPKEEHGKIRLETHNVPAFVTEEYMPPENEMKFRVDFIYIADTDSAPEKDPKVFWKKYGKRAYGHVDDFIDKRRAMAEALQQIVAPGDSPEEKLRKIYERAQRLRNTSFERRKSAQEEEREKLKSAGNVEDIWKHGYADGNQIAWLFLALVRAAGIPADPVIVSTRDVHFFNVNAMNPNDLNSNVVVVTLDGKELYLDPGTPFVPFGSLPWSETAVPGLRLAKDGGTWINTPLSKSKESRTERNARLQLTSSGTLEGKVTVTYTGQEALWRRLEERNEDDADRKQFLEDQIKSDIPSGADVELSNRPDWDSASQPLVAEYGLKLQGWAARAGQRSLLPVGLFGAQEKHAFQHTVRVHPLYFNFPHQSADSVSIELPAAWQVSSVPKPCNVDRASLVYSASTEGKTGSLLLSRELKVDAMLVLTKYYPTVQDFFQTVRARDEEQVVLLAVKNAAGH
jgi:transglutaminase-like putative cysteine protease